MRTRLLAGNWKLNKSIAEARSLVAELRQRVEGIREVEVVVCPPFTALAAVAEAARGSQVQVGAQDVFWKESGAYTGEVAPGMLREAGATYVIVGHSERRGRFGKPEFTAAQARVFGDSDETVNAKAAAALAAGLTPIVCCGETLAERERGETDAMVAGQVQAALRDLPPPEPGRLVLAYEPVWAIGTGQVCAEAEANRVCGLVRATVAERFGVEVAATARVLYGGSATPANLALLLNGGEIDGALVGGASLQAESFAAMVKIAVGG